MATLVIRAIDQETANASGAHLSEGDLLAGEFGRAPLNSRSRSANYTANQREEASQPLARS
jgi:hypothetical protein